jgi:hypothetical protein
MGRPKGIMSKGRLSLSDNRGEINFNLSLIIFEEDGAVIAYCPPLDLAGYGNNEEEAKKSFEFVVSEYFNYTTKKGTLITDLKGLGWNIKKNLRKQATPPEDSYLLKKNNNFKRIFETHDYRKTSTQVQIPALA